MGKTHTACVVVYKKTPGVKCPDFLVMEYQSTLPLTQKLSEKEVRFVSGTNKNHPGESSEETAVRKLREETGLIGWDLKSADKDLVADHFKYGFIVDIEACGGRLRTTLLRRRGDVMSAPYFANADELEKLIAPVHRWLYDAAWERLCV